MTMQSTMLARGLTLECLNFVPLRLRQRRQAVPFAPYALIHCARVSTLLKDHRHRMGLSIRDSSRPVQDISSYNDSLASLAKAAAERDWFRATTVFQGIPCPDVKYWQAMLHAADRCGRLAEAEEVFAKMPATYRRINGYTSLINLNSRVGNVPRTRELLQEMMKDDIQPDVYVLSAMLAGFSRARDVEGALAFWQEMLALGIEPSKTSFLSLMNVFAAAGRPELVMEWIGKMDAHNHRATQVHWNVALKACQVKQDGAMARDVLAKMRAASIDVSIVSYTAVFLAVLRDPALQDVQKAQQASLLKEMAEAGIEKDSHFYERCAVASLGAEKTGQALQKLGHISAASAQAALDFLSNLTNRKSRYKRRAKEGFSCRPERFGWRRRFAP
eukprot:TRINITY_DN59483_c0_g1_i3.p1 TRINITY_DN59483_c0_g1~~TRINITY_DN59483_c0_g1_i3.p1  ORF type:complete len:388 (-),score=64.23 TRINITY_DN59483_c0_g1_i3:200-1363(-)